MGIIHSMIEIDHIYISISFVGFWMSCWFSSLKSYKQNTPNKHIHTQQMLGFSYTQIKLMNTTADIVCWWLRIAQNNKQISFVRERQQQTSDRSSPHYQQTDEFRWILLHFNETTITTTTTKHKTICLTLKFYSALYLFCYFGCRFVDLGLSISYRWLFLPAVFSMCLPSKLCVVHFVCECVYRSESCTI